MQPAFQDEFVRGLVSRYWSVPAGIDSWKETRPHRRFAVYRNNAAGALIEALALRYPVTQRLVGSDFFGAMAREFTFRHMPKSPVLLTYGAAFPGFVEEFAPAQSLPYLADVAALESAHWQAYHAPDDQPVAMNAFSELDQARLETVTVELLSSVKIIRSAFPIVSIWRTNAEDLAVREVDMSVAESSLVARPAMDVVVRALPPGAADFLAALQAGETMGVAANRAAEFSDFDLGRTLALVIESRIVKNLRQFG